MIRPVLITNRMFFFFFLFFLGGGRGGFFGGPFAAQRDVSLGGRLVELPVAVVAAHIVRVVFGRRRQV